MQVIKDNGMKSYQLLLALLLFFNVASGQQKRNLTVDNYKLWSEFGGAGMSGNGDWIYYSLLYRETDTLCLQNSKTNLRFSFPKAHSPSFAPDSKWFGWIKNDSLTVLELVSGKKHFVADSIGSYDFSGNGNYLIAIVHENGSDGLKIVDLETYKTLSIASVTNYALSPDRSKFAVIAELNGVETVKVIDFANLYQEKVIVSGDAPVFKGLKWDVSGKKLAFFKEEKTGATVIDPIIYWCTGFEGNIIVKTLNPNTNRFFPKGNRVIFSGLYPSAKGNRVFFDIKPLPGDTVPPDKNAVQIWLPEDTVIPHVDAREKLRQAVKWTMWNVDNDTIMPVEDDEHGNVVLTGNEDHALLYNLEELTPLHKYGGEFIAVYIKDLLHGGKELLLPRHHWVENHIIVSPAGKYIAYFKDKDWWVYDIALKKHRCLTTGMPLPLYRLDYDRPAIPVLGSSGWTLNDEEMIVYDQFDIWLLKPDGSSRRRITSGEKTGTVYRLHEKQLGPTPKDSFFGFQVAAYDFDKSIILKTQNSATLGEGYAVYDNGSVTELVKKESVMNLIDCPKNEKGYLLLESNFELPPRLFTVNRAGKEKLIQQFNPQQKDFFWGRSSLIYYTVSGKKLRGALFYPANYDPGKKYPMIVCIYERKSKEALDYVVPSMNSMYGFNITNYTADGYFVLYPDIAFSLNTTGNDALECVKAAVGESLKITAIDESNIALIGHSFGGFEAAYIMGYSTIFKTAVIGAPMIDLVSAYLTTDGSGLSNMWRFEYDQFRMPAPFYSAVFDDNSPLRSAKDVKSPILLWTGTADKQLDWKHAMKMHNALWRLGKKSTLLVYPNEEHILIQEKNQLDLTSKVRDWLDHYLKGKPLQQWMGKQ